jgi:hypothetical protein
VIPGAIELTSGTLAAASAVIMGLIAMRRFYRWSIFRKSGNRFSAENATK